jgi:hypothetical protein
MPFQKRPDRRRRVFLDFIGKIENGLRDAYGTRYEQGRTNQSMLAKKLNVHRSVIHHRLTGQKNLTIKSIADLIWGLDWGVKIDFFDPEKMRGENVSILQDMAAPPPGPRQAKPISTDDPTAPRPMDLNSVS